MQTKESLRREIARREAEASEASRLAFAEGDFFAGLAWGAKLPAYGLIRARVNRLPYETGEDVDAVGAAVLECAERIDPGGSLSRFRFHQLRPGADSGGWGRKVGELIAGATKDAVLDRVVVGIDVGRVRQDPDGTRTVEAVERIGLGRGECCHACGDEIQELHVVRGGRFCSAFCGSVDADYAPSTSLNGITRSVVHHLKEVVPVGIGWKKALGLVAMHAGVAPVPPVVGTCLAEVRKVAEALDDVVDTARRAGKTPLAVCEEAAARLRAALGTVRR